VLVFPSRDRDNGIRVIQSVSNRINHRDGECQGGTVEYGGYKWSTGL
jgi:hypothetical protein